MPFRRMLLIGFALLSLVAVVDLGTPGSDRFEGRFFTIETLWDEVGRVPARPPTVEERRTLDASTLLGDGAQAVRAVVVENTLGRLEIRPSPSGELTAEYAVRVWEDASKGAPGGAAALLNEVAMAWVREGDQVRLTLQRPETLPSGIENLFVDVKLGVPPGVDVVTEHTGDVAIEGILGSVRLESAGGKAVVQDVQGAVEVNSRVTDLSIRRVLGPVQFEVRGGRAEIQEIRGRVEGAGSYIELVVEDVAEDVHLTLGQGFSRVRKVGGDLALQGGYGESHVSGVAGDVTIAYRLGSVKVGVSRSAELSVDLGDMEVYLEGDGGWTVAAVAEMGEIETALPLRRLESGLRTEVSGTIGDGAHPFKLEVSRGTVRLARR
jgi:hypothetical protein